MRNNYVIKDNIATIYLTERKSRTKQTKVSIDTLNLLLLRDCKLYIDKVNGYAFIYFYDEKKQYRLHRWIVQTKKHLTIDHINKDRLDNRICNLKEVTRAENTRLMQKRKR